MLIGEPINNYGPGVIHIYRNQGGTWKKTGAITAPNGHALDRFGRSLSLDGNRLLVGATSYDDSIRGSGFIYERNRSGVWQLVTTLVPASATAGNAYGRQVMLKGDEAYLVSWGANGNRGAVAIFRRGPNSQWSEAGSLVPSDTMPQLLFGSNISQDGNLLVVGASQTDTARGAAYVFDRSAPGGSWNQVARLRLSDVPRGTLFGAAVLVAGETVLVGAPGLDSAQGAVVAYGRDGSGQWVERRRITPASPESRAQFGSTLRLVNGELWVAAGGAKENRGVVYRMTRGADGSWAEAGTLKAPGAEPGDFFGSAIAMAGDVGVIGLPNDDFGAGTATFVSHSAAGWTVGNKVWESVEQLKPMVGSRRNCGQGNVGVFECRNINLFAFLPIAEIGGKRGVQLNDLWGWTDPSNGREYALVGRIDGTSFVDITDPTHPRMVGDLPKTPGSPASAWRDIKVYKDHAYIVADGAAAHGMQVFDLTRLRSVGSTPEVFTPDTTYDRIHSAHNIVIDTVSGFAYAVGANSGGETCGGALHMIDIREPAHPKFAGCFGDPGTGLQHTGYTHDAQCVVYSGPDSAYRGHQICFNSSETALGIADVTDKANPRAISHAAYPNVAYSHQGWLTDDQHYFYMDDEGDEAAGTVAGTRTLIWDVSDLDDPVMAGEFIQEVKSIDHNLYIKGDLMYESNYTSGLRIIDISDRLKPRLVGNFDTTPTGENLPVFEGSWSNYPYFKSGTIAVTSIGEGLFLLQGPEHPSVP
ncbi:MAG: choice-of-anchor B family protein [Gemmatimonadota bacterium]